MIRFAGLVLNVFPRVGCNKLRANRSGGGSDRDPLIDANYSLDLIYLSTFTNTKNTQLFCLVLQSKTSSCSCSKGRISCSEFCGCRKEGCRNKWNMMRDDDDDNDSDSYDSDDENDD